MPQVTQFENRDAVPDGVYNFRDLGGLRTAAGEVVRSGRLFRSDSLHWLTERGVTDLLTDLGVRYLIDLRDTEEVLSEGRGLLGSRPLCYVNVPQPQMHNPRGGPDEALYGQYVERLDSTSALADALEMVRSVNRGPTVVHCAAGKDRTGLVIALVLLLIGVPEERVVEDYMRTANNLKPILSRFQTSTRYRASMAKLPPEVYMCQEHVIRRFIEVLEVRYGGAHRWAESKNLSGLVEDLRTGLLE